MLRRGKFHSGHLKTLAAAGKNTGHVRLSFWRGVQRAGQVKDAQLSRVPVGLQENQSDVISICHVQTVTRTKTSPAAGQHLCSVVWEAVGAVRVAVLLPSRN